MKAKRLKAYGQFGAVHYEAEPGGDVVRIADLPPEVVAQHIEPRPAPELPDDDDHDDDEDDDA